LPNAQLSFVQRTSASVLMMPLLSILRMRTSFSQTYRLPAGSNASPYGVLTHVSTARPPSPHVAPKP
jgi:hypothetical protein